MSFIDDLKAKADANGGKLTKEDIEGYMKANPDIQDKLAPLRDKADSNGDGKIDFEDAKRSFEDIGNNIKSIFNK